VSTRLSVCLLSLCLCAVPGFSQSRQTAPPPVRSGDVNPTMTDEEEARARITHDMEKKAAKERVAALKTDTDKLLKLSVELKQYVDKSDENVLSLDVIKRAEEIEKLAHSVREKMKGPN
jgi:DNA-binding transcriptional regulator GbsR (MarR family)